MKIIRFLSLLSVFGSIAWMVSKPDWEPAIAIVVSLSAMIGTYLAPEEKVLGQSQVVDKGGIGIQSGRDVKVGDIHNNNERAGDA